MRIAAQIIDDRRFERMADKLLVAPIHRMPRGLVLGICSIMTHMPLLFRDVRRDALYQGMLLADSSCSHTHLRPRVERPPPRGTTSHAQRVHALALGLITNEWNTAALQRDPGGYFERALFSSWNSLTHIIQLAHPLAALMMRRLLRTYHMANYAARPVSAYCEVWFRHNMAQIGHVEDLVYRKLDHANEQGMCVNNLLLSRLTQINELVAQTQPRGLFLDAYRQAALSRLDTIKPWHSAGDPAYSVSARGRVVTAVRQYDNRMERDPTAGDMFGLTIVATWCLLMMPFATVRAIVSVTEPDAQI
jgi:hypothetical protein